MQLQSALCCLLLAASVGSRAANSAEKRLTRELLDRYDDWGVVGRPVRNSSHVLTVRLGLALVQILDLEENKQRLRTNCWLRFTWRDSLLSWRNWTEPEYSAIQQIRVLPSQIWTPDIKLYNFADDRLLEKRDARVVVQQNGDILWVPQALLKSTCKVKILNFPFDTQHCHMHFGSWTYDESQLWLDWSLTTLQLNGTHTVTKTLPFVDFSDYVKSNEWATDGELEVDETDPDARLRQARSAVVHRSEMAAGGWRRYRILEFRIRLMRNPSFYVAILVVPCILLSMLTLVLFWLPPESPAKMLLGMNIFIAFFILLLLLSEQIPSAVEAFPLLGCYYCVNMGIITFSTFAAVLVVNLHFHGDRSGSLPPLLKRLLVDGLGSLFLIRRDIPLPDSPRGSCDSEEAAGRKATASSCSERGRNIPPAETIRRRPAALLLLCPRQVQLDLSDISRSIRRLVGRRRATDAENSVSVQWRTLALVLDRVFFVLYLVLISVFLLVFIPRRQEADNAWPE